MILLALALIFAVWGRPTKVKVPNGSYANGRPFYNEIPAPPLHVVTWAVVCVALAAGVVTLGVVERL